MSESYRIDESDVGLRQGDAVRLKLALNARLRAPDMACKPYGRSVGYLAQKRKKMESENESKQGL